MPRSRQGYGKLYLLILAALVLLSLFFALSGSLSLLEDFTPPDSADPFYLFLAVLCNLMFWITASFSWQLTVWRICNVRIPFLLSFAQISLVLVGKYLPGKLWGLAFRGKDLTNQGVSNYQALICSQVEQLISIHAGITIGGLGWLFYYQPEYWQYLLFILLVLPLLGSMLNNFFVGRLVSYMHRYFSTVKLSDHEISFGTYLSLFGMFLLEWASVGAILYCLWAAIFASTFDLAIASSIISANTVAFLIGFFAFFAPGGIGVREGVLVGLLAATMGLPQAVYITVLYRIWLVITDAFAGLLSLRILGGTYWVTK